MDLEEQRYGRNKNTLVDKTYIDSGEYRRKFDKISDNIEVVRSVYILAKTALKHRSGTELEDMYWVDGDTGKIVAQEIDALNNRAIVYSNNTRQIIKESSDNLIALHTHPNSMPPSAADFNSCYRNQYRLGIVVCHNGKVFVYTSDEEMNERIYNTYIFLAVSKGMSEYDAQIDTLNRMKKFLKIDFWEVN